jgi:hypothetical protein
MKEMKAMLASQGWLALGRKRVKTTHREVENARTGDYGQKY